MYPKKNKKKQMCLSLRASVDPPSKVIKYNQQVVSDNKENNLLHHVDALLLSPLPVL